MTSSIGRTEPTLRHPVIDDGAALWRIARDSQVLDVNSPYAYLLWCRDFATTSVVADDGPNSIVGFVTGYVRPDDPETYMLWQVAVDESARGRGIAGSMLDWVFDSAQRNGPAVVHLETTITDDNGASRHLFGTFAERHSAPLIRAPLFTAEAFPHDTGESHNPEVLHRIGPIDTP